MVDPGRLRALLDRLGEELGHLRRHAARDSKELLGDRDDLAGVKYRFVIAIETCIDAGQHIISSEGLRAPESFADVFAILGETGFLAPSSAPALQEMARFRNVLVHAYADVDDSRVVDILKTRLDDFDSFRAGVARAALKDG